MTALHSVARASQGGTPTDWNHKVNNATPASKLATGSTLRVRPICQATTVSVPSHRNWNEAASLRTIGASTCRVRGLSQPLSRNQRSMSPPVSVTR